MKKNKKGNRIILFFIFIVGIVWSCSGILMLKPILFEKSSNYSLASEYPNILLENNSTNTTQINNSLFTKIENEPSFSKPTYKIDEKEINIPILIYHEITHTLPKKDIYNIYILASRFEENITTLLDAGYTFITFDDLYNYYKGKIGLPEKCVIITVDDGWERQLYNNVSYFKKI